MKQKKCLFLIILALSFTLTGCDTITGFFKKDKPPIVDETPEPSVEPETAPTDENATTPTDENETTPTDENATAPTDENATAPTDENQTTPADENATTPTDENLSIPIDIENNTPQPVDIEKLKGTIDTDLYVNDFNKFQLTAPENWKISYSNLPIEQSPTIGTIVKPIIVSLLENDQLTTIIPTFQYSEDASLLLTIESYINKIKLENNAFELGLIQNITEPKETTFASLPAKFISYDLLESVNLKATPAKCYIYFVQKDNNVYVITITNVTATNKPKVLSVIKNITIG